ncbi:hypothetical protein C5167_011152 [Papaver somniferum]|uniref:Proton pump-interactor 1 n=1 Tax=Papaver somniferum TaxID=3469 RepID=A0A4Y7K5H5_PAPSO|nr:uncharacterized protein LOC113289701 [Papaver somniferum]RZC67461.1 hypothetical protein C5167_011152 [Papaver somniferum]
MSVETDVPTGIVVDSSEKEVVVECEGGDKRENSNSMTTTSSCEKLDLPKNLNGDCNGDEIKDDAEDTDGSYVFVDDSENRPVSDTELVDHVVVHDRDDRPAEDRGEPVVADVPVDGSVASELGTENPDLHEEENVVVSSSGQGQDDVAAAEPSSECMSSNALDEEEVVVVEQNDAVVEEEKPQKQEEDKSAVEESTETHVPVTEAAVESKPPEEVETTSVTEENSINIEGDAVDSKLNHIDNGEANEVKSTDLNSTEEADNKDQEAHPTSTGEVELELHQVDCEEKSEPEAAAKVEGNHETQVLGDEGIINGGEKETEKEASKEEPLGQHACEERVLKMEAAISPEKVSQLDKEAKDVAAVQDTQILVTESAEREPHQLVNGDMKEAEKEAPLEVLSVQVDTPLEKEETKDVEEDQNSQIFVTQSVEFELRQTLNEVENGISEEASMEEQSVNAKTQQEVNLEVSNISADDSPLDKEPNDIKEAGSSTKPVEPESPQLVNEDARETEKEIPVEESPMHIGAQKDLDLETAESPSDDSHVDSETANGIKESVPDVSVQCTALEPEIFAEGQETVQPREIDIAQPESEDVNESVENSNVVDCVVLENDTEDLPIKKEDSLPSVPGHCADSVPEIENSPDSSVNYDNVSESSAVTEVGNDSAEVHQSVSTCSVENVTSEAETCDNSAESNHHIPSSTILFGDVGVLSEGKEAYPDKNIPVGDKTEVEVARDSAVLYIENEGIAGKEMSGPHPSSDDTTNDASEGQKMNEEVVKKPFRFLIRIPRYVDDKIREEIRLAQLQVDEKTRARDAIGVAIQAEKATLSEHRDKFEAAKSEERAVRKLLRAKREEIDSVQSTINRMKSETSIDEIDDRINYMEHRIEHETMPLKEEKQLIRDIKQLKNVKDQLSSSLGKQTKEQLSLDKREKIEEQFKLLKRELDSSWKEVLRYEGITTAARKIYDDEADKLTLLHSQFRAENDMRQEAYIRLQNLKKQLYEKNKYFRMYKGDEHKARELASKGDKEELQRLCVDQVEKMMELWNNNADFRKEYMRCNSYSTLRRFKTLDGRSLGPDEEPPVLRTFTDVKPDNTVAAALPLKTGPTLPVTTSLQGSSTEKAEVKPVVHLEQRNPKADVKPAVVSSERNLTAAAKAKSKKVGKPVAALETSPVTISDRDKVELEENKQREEEEKERARKADELRKEKEAAAAKLKEQRRLEEKAKAKEAEERKKRNAEKAQVKAELRAKKEAELKEKEREKKARKKEKKVAAAAAGEERAFGDEGESAPSSGNTTHPEATSNIVQEQPGVKEKAAAVVTKRKGPQKLLAQPKVKALPATLRNRSKRRMQPWMWVLLAALVVVALFLLGNSGYSFKSALSSFGF